MIALLHVAFVWAVGISNVKQLLTSLVPWYVSARDDCYTYVMLTLAGKKCLGTAVFITTAFKSFIAKISMHPRAWRSTTLPSQQRWQIYGGFFYSRKVHVHWNRPRRKYSSWIYVCNSTYPLQYTNLNPTGQRPQPKCYRQRVFQNHFN